ncbi:MAG: hypothetical protein EBW24_00270 [Actinobacteria bacterium]|jgi:hypothetical protein|nr:hypothetical protein [Actinomycetota bacterium]NDG25333.1 hypothetical protein [Actinomycetota bacterium]
MAKLSTYLAKITKRVATLFFKFFNHFFLKISQICANNYQKSTGELIFWLFFSFFTPKLGKILKIAIILRISSDFLTLFWPISCQNGVDT